MKKIKLRGYLKNDKRMVEITGADFGDYWEWEYELDGEYYTIANEYIEIMQFTGVYDVNNKEIYKNDILEFSSSGMYTISFSEGECAFVCEKQDPYNYLSPEVWSKCKIVGNVCEKKLIK